MATFAKKTFNTASYAAARPSYPQKLYDLILAYHQGPREQCLDLGCGHGIVARQFGSNFSRFLGTDPSEGMIEQARKLTPKAQFPFAEFRVGFAEDDVPIPTGGVDVVTAAQASHWFNQPKLYPLLRDKVRRGGTLAFWGYKDPVFADYPKATAILNDYAYSQDKDKLGSYWPKGREIVQDKLRAIKPPESDWEDIQRTEYEPDTRGVNSGEGTVLMHKRIKVGEYKEYVRTWSPYHGWQETHPDAVARNKGGKGDIADIIFDDLAREDEIMGDEESEIEIEWGSAVILARRR
ncbi:putative S-adenosylmethionine-dependent methyltransferase [Myriangium duriaei CBS 260.36]|uniref:S-adenosylmethionine-dependent methyltransferase n=1 Tax=Myriangium duriaei CBS 260.36 TaxID=1168546 RepID=A0A9P4IZZ9_9PEZI|nr:putative S-adenosylmethionine-dependent methyltransferase [Myriangium duriaei CBS 260.36]